MGKCLQNNFLLVVPFQTTQGTNTWITLPHLEISRNPCMNINQKSLHYESGLLRKQVIKKLHSETVHNCIQNYDKNKILNTSPPPINSDELNLTRKERVELARLRSGYSRSVNSYLHKLDEQVEDKCPSCATSPHDVNHLFECKDNPTDLTINSLWSNPRAVSNFLKLKDESDDET